jgi:preprotein translocase subunit SecG
MLEALIVVLHVATAGAVVVLVLLQQGKGADMGAAFGSGSAGSLFGASGSANFLSRSTAILATLFFATSLVLTYIATHDAERGGGIMIGPAKPAPAPAGQIPVPTVPAPAGPVPVPLAPVDAVPKAGDVTK